MMHVRLFLVFAVWKVMYLLWAVNWPEENWNTVLCSGVFFTQN